MVYGSYDIDGTGFAVSSAGDLNGDGIADLIFGSPFLGNKKGGSAIIFGSTNLITRIDGSLSAQQGLSILSLEALRYLQFSQLII
jgi:hypothetical protein